MEKRRGSQTLLSMWKHLKVLWLFIQIPNLPSHSFSLFYPPHPNNLFFPRHYFLLFVHFFSQLLLQGKERRGEHLINQGNATNHRNKGIVKEGLYTSRDVCLPIEGFDPCGRVIEQNRQGYRLLLPAARGDRSIVTNRRRFVTDRWMPIEGQ